MKLLRKAKKIGKLCKISERLLTIKWQSVYISIANRFWMERGAHSGCCPNCPVMAF